MSDENEGATKAKRRAAHGGGHPMSDADGNRLISSVRKDADAFEATIRPQSLDEFIGQEQARANLRVFIQAAKGARRCARSRAVRRPAGPRQDDARADHGEGARRRIPRHVGSGDLRRPAISPRLLTNLEDRDVLFIDEIHRLNPAVEEILYPAMEDFQLDLIIGEGPAARSVQDRSRQVHARRRDDARGSARPRRCATGSAFRSGSTSTPSTSSSWS